MRRKEREITDIQELEGIIKDCDVCRVALADGNVPYIVTMNFGYSADNGIIYFHSALEGKKIDMMRKNDYVCFAMDTDHVLRTGKNACDFGMSYSSVVGYGNISIVKDHAERVSGLNHIMSHYAGKGEFSYKSDVIGRTLVLRLDIKEMTGKRS
jgi:nitroimidazol reductase NimA-like FMN-containing flavoprotein (pyridoxamine 5'-phosphate oxidase superfamily)